MLVLEMTGEAGDSSRTVKEVMLERRVGGSMCKCWEDTGLVLDQSFARAKQG